MDLSDKVFWWTGAALCFSGGWALVAVCVYVALEFTLKTLRVTSLVLQWKWDKMKASAPRIVTKKSES